MNHNSVQSQQSNTQLWSNQIQGPRPEPSMVSAIIGVIRYEAIRSLTLLRILIWLGLVAFPVGLIIATLQIVQIRMPANQDFNAVVMLMFILLPQSVTVLSMLLFAAPIVNAELESQSWIYAIIRPNARKAILLGKYFIAVMWCGSCTSMATLLIITAAKLYQVPNIESALGTQLALCWLAAFSYGALFLTIGTFFQRRAMVYAFAYSLGVEALMGWIPAVVNLFTISYRLRSLLFGWIFAQDSSNQIEQIPFLWENNPLKHLAILAAIVVGLLTASIWRIERSQYRWQTEV